MGAKNTYSVWSAEMDPEVTGRAGRELIDCGLSFKEARELRRKHEGSVVEKDDPAALAAADAEEEALTEDIFELPPAPEVTPEPLSDQVQIDLPRPFSVAKAPKKTAIRLVDDPEQVKQDAQDRKSVV